jgi:hypothetical protein
LRSPALNSDLGEAGASEDTGRTYDCGSDDSNPEVWGTSNFFSFILSLTKMAACLWGHENGTNQAGRQPRCTKCGCKDTGLMQAIIAKSTVPSPGHPAS